MPEPRITDVMVAHAQSAVDYARKRFRYDLDFSPASLESVDRMATAMFHDVPRTFLAKALRRGPNEAEVWNLAKMLGGYAGEVVRRQWGGRWKSTLVPDGHPDVFLDIHGVRCRPIEEVHKRLLDGSGIKTETLYAELSQQLEKMHAPHALQPHPPLPPTPSATAPGTGGHAHGAGDVRP